MIGPIIHRARRQSAEPELRPAASDAARRRWRRWSAAALRIVRALALVRERAGAGLRSALVRERRRRAWRRRWPRRRCWRCCTRSSAAFGRERRELNEARVARSRSHRLRRPGPDGRRRRSCRIRGCTSGPSCCCRWPRSRPDWRHPGDGRTCPAMIRRRCRRASRSAACRRSSDQLAAAACDIPPISPCVAGVPLNILRQIIRLPSHIWRAGQQWRASPSKTASSRSRTGSIWSCWPPSGRATSRAGAALTVERDNDKNPVVALREIADDTIDLDALHAVASCRACRSMSRPTSRRKRAASAPARPTCSSDLMQSAGGAGAQGRGRREIEDESEDEPMAEEDDAAASSRPEEG